MLSIPAEINGLCAASCYYRKVISMLISLRIGARLCFIVSKNILNGCVSSTESCGFKIAGDENLPYWRKFIEVFVSI